MNIPIRIKFFVVLLAFSLGPIFISRGIVGKAGVRMKAETAAKAREELQGIVSADLEANANSLLEITSRGGRAMQFAVSLVAQQAGHSLDGHVPGYSATPYFVQDFADSTTAPADFAVVSGYEQQTRSGAVKPLPVSLSRPAFLLPHGVGGEAANDDIQKLLRLLPDIRQAYDTLMQAPYWINIGLESGVFMTYPGHGRFPMMYDHRSQEWYRLAARQGARCSWDSPAVDPSTRGVITTVSHPIYNEKGEFIGAASLDIPIANVMGDSELRQQWRGEIRSFMIERAAREDGKGEGLSIIARQYPEDGSRHHWMTGVKREWLESDDTQAFAALLDALKNQHSGVAHLPFEGVPSVWAFASNENISFILITPESVASRLPDDIIASLEYLFDEMRDIAAIISGVMLIVTGLIAWFGSRTITRPVIAMADAARRLADGDFTAHITARSGDERDILVESFNSMGPKLEEHLRISKDLELAKEVQRMLLPTKTPDFPGFDISGGISYCDQTGGDYYDFINVSREKGRALGVVLGDVSGHGVPSALVMATARGQLHSLSEVPMDAADRIGAINRFMSNDLDGTGRFLTLFYLRLEENSGMVQWVRAGHDPAIRFNPATGEFGELGGDGLALGVLPDFDFRVNEAELASGEIVVLCTDGVWEARGVNGAMFGKQRLLAIIRDNAHKSSEGIRQSIMEAVAAYQANGQEDDIAVVVIRKI